MASKILTFLFVCLAVLSVSYAKPAANPGIIAGPAVVAPYASTYNAHVVNHAVTAPVVASAAYVASPYLASPYLASPYSAYYGGYPGSYVL